MKNKLLVLILTAVMAAGILSGCSAKETSSDSKAAATEEVSADSKTTVTEDASIDPNTAVSEEASANKDETPKCELEDGTYMAKFNTDSGMFHVNEVYDGKGTLTVKDGKMTLHVTLNSKNIVNLFVGKAEDAQKDGAELLEPTTDTVAYSDGETEDVYGFDVPVPELDKEFDLALIGKKEIWYDHKVSVTDPVKIEE